MVYAPLLVIFALFTLLDVLITFVGLEVGCIELNPVVNAWGVNFWALFRVILLMGMLTSFIVGYRHFKKYFTKGLFYLKTSVIILDLYMGVVILSGIFAVIVKINQ